MYVSFYLLLFLFCLVIHVLCTVSYPLLGISGKLEVDAKPKSIDIELDGTYDKNTFEVGLEAKVGTKHKLDYDVDFEVCNYICRERTHLLYKTYLEETLIRIKYYCNCKTCLFD